MATGAIARVACERGNGQRRWSGKLGWRNMAAWIGYVALYLAVAREPHTAEKSSVSRRLRRLTRGYGRAFWPGRGDQRLKCLGGSDDRLWRFTPGSRDAALPLHRPHLSPGLRTQTSGGGGRMHVSSLAAAISDSFISRLWQNWRSLCQGRVPFCRSPSYPGGSFQKGREERRHRAAASRRRGATRKGPRRAHRGGTREGVDLEIVAAEGTGEGAPPAHGLGTRAGLCQSLLFLSLGYRMGRGVLENQRLRALSDLALAEWPRLGQTAVRESRHHLSGPGQRLSQLQRSRRFAADLRPPWSRRRARVLPAMAAASALAV